MLVVEGYERRARDAAESAEEDRRRGAGAARVWTSSLNGEKPEDYPKRI